MLGVQIVEWLRVLATYAADPGLNPGQRTLLHVTPPLSLLSIHCQIKVSMPEKNPHMLLKKKKIGIHTDDDNQRF